MTDRPAAGPSDAGLPEDGVPGDGGPDDGGPGNGRQRADLERFARYGDDLVARVEAALGPWVRRSVTSRLPVPAPPGIDRRIDEAAARARDDVVPRLRELLACDVDDQWTNPLSILRSAVVHPTAVLAEVGATPVARDDTAHRLRPDDVFDLAPAAFADLSDEAHEAGIVWGAAKAHLHLRRHGGKADGLPRDPGVRR